MSTLSKVFVILVFTVAVAKLAIDATLFAQQVDWKDKFVREVNYHYATQQVKNAEIAARDLEIQNLQVFIQILDTKINTLDTENSAKAQRINDLGRMLNDSTTLAAKLEADQQVFVRQLEVQLAQIQQMNVKVNEFRSKLAKSIAEKSTAVADLQYARQMSERMSHDLSELEGKHVDLARNKKQLEEKINHLAQLGIRTDIAPKAPLEGKVTAVAPEIGLVVISIGRDDGVMANDEFTVFRQGEFVAKIVVDRADRKWSAGKVVLKKTDPRVADDVSNHIFVSAPARGN